MPKGKKSKVAIAKHAAKRVTLNPEDMKSWRKQWKDGAKAYKQEVRKDGNVKQTRNPDDASGAAAKSRTVQVQEKTSFVKQHPRQDQAEFATTPEPVTVKVKRKKEVSDVGAEVADVEPLKKKKKTHEQPETVRAQEVVSTDPEAFKVVVAGIPTTVSEEALRKDFEECGEVLSCRLLRHRDTKVSRGIAFVSFTNQTALSKALDFDGDDYGGRKLTVQISEGGKERVQSKGTIAGLSEKPSGCTSVIVKGLAFSVTEADLTKTFKNSGEGPTHINMLMNKESGTFKGIAFIDFDDEVAVDEAVKLSGTELKGRRFQIDFATPREKSKGPGEKLAGCTSVVVKGLDYSVTEADLNKSFRKCGSGPTNIRIALDSNTQKSRGIAFIDFGDAEGVEQAAQLHGTELRGRSIIVEYAKTAGGEDGGKAKDKGPGKKPIGCTSITVKGFGEAITEQRLTKFFSGCRSVNIVMDNETGLSTGLAFVNFGSTSAVDEAIKLNGTELKGNTLTLGYVKPKPPKVRE